MKKHPSVERRHRRSLRVREQNKRHVSRLRTGLKGLRGLIAENKAPESKEALGSALSLIDRSVSRKALHRNAAARLKSRLTRQVNALAK